MKEKILKILNELHEDVDFETRDDLVDSGILDSLDLVVLVGELCDVFDIEITAEHMLPHNFNSVQNMMELVKSLK